MVHQCSYGQVKQLIYKHEDVCVYRVVPTESAQEMMYCQGVCLLGKLFMAEKTTFYHLDGFELFVAYNSHGEYQGFFSKEMQSIN